MSRTTTTPIRLLALLAITLTTPTYAQLGGGYAGFGGSYGGGDDNPYSDNDGDGNDNGSYDYGLGVGYDGAVRARTAHGILACVAFVILFPLGGILLRAIPGRWSFHAHWVVQMLAWVLYVAAFALGVELVREVRFPGDTGDFISNPHTNYHPIIGIIVFILLLIQPLLGIIHHQNFKRLQRRTLSSHLHLWDGRIAIVLGLVNGGLGLQLAGAADTRNKHLSFLTMNASKPQEPHSLPMMPEHDELSRQPTPEDLHVAQGEKGRGAKGYQSFYKAQPKQYAAFPAPLSSNISFLTKPPGSLSKARSHVDNTALNGPEHKPGNLASNPLPPWKQGSLARDALPRSPNDPRRVQQAEQGQNDVATIPGLPVNGMHELAATLTEPRPSTNDVNLPLQSVGHRQETPGKNSSDDGDADKAESDPFLETGQPIRAARVGTESTVNTTPAIPKLGTLDQSSTPFGASAPVSLEDDTEDPQFLADFMSLEHTLKSNEEEYIYQSSRAGAVRDVQQELLRRSELSYVGIAEGRIMRREAAKLDTMSGEAQTRAQKAQERIKGLECFIPMFGSPHTAIDRLFKAGQSALWSGSNMSGQEVSDPTSHEAVVQTAQCPVLEHQHLAILTAERRALKSQVEQLEEEKKQHCRDISTLRRQVDDLKARQSVATIHGQNVPQSLVPGLPVPSLDMQTVTEEPLGAHGTAASYNFI
ncbi:hypothetical protein VP1G_03023 [Cytospora mali]|uniref:Cytochrome b561 domain-containing protein n=1 Tax=Cytospora mali TaxID=578113 RepID=A0A194UVN2_CYTMA|nr:hypothetical protein VP1G_03023 [Valsa mali var. pyri (nom. inval.)]